MSIGKASRNHTGSKSLLDIPGPGEYKMNNNTRSTAPNYRFGSSTRGEEGKSKKVTPDPWNYEYKNMIGKEASQTSLHPKLPYKPIE